LDLGIGGVTCDEVAYEVQAGHRAGHLGGVDVAIDPERRLLCVRTGGRVGDRRQPDVTALEAATDRIHAQQLRMRVGELAQTSRQLSVTVIRVEPDVGHSRAPEHPQARATRWRRCRAASESSASAPAGGSRCPRWLLRRLLLPVQARIAVAARENLALA